MGINLARQSLGWPFVWVTLLLLLFCGRGTTYPVELTASYVRDMPLGEMLAGLAARMPVLCSYISIFLVLLNTVLITSIVSRNMIYTDKMFMPAVIYVVVSCGNYFGGEAIVGIVASWLVICSCSLTINSFRRQKQYGKTFLAAIMLGALPLIYPPAVVFAVMIPVSLAVFRKDWHEAVISITGYVLPFVIASYIYWGMGEPFSYLGLAFYGTLLSCAEQAAFIGDFVRPDLLVFWGVTAITATVSIFIFFNRAPLMRTRPYKSYIFFIWLLVASAVLFAAPCRSVNDFPLIAVPLSVVMPMFFSRQEGWVTNITYLAFTISVVMFNALPFFSAR